MRVDLLPAGEQRRLPGDFRHQLVDVFELLERRPSVVARPPVRAGPQPHGERLGEILVRMALRVPQPQMLDEISAGRIRPVIARIALRGSAEQLLPLATALQLIGVLHHVAGFVAKNAHAFGPGAALDVDDHLPLELHQALVGEIERDRDARRVFRAEPLARDPGMGHAPGCRARPAPRGGVFRQSSSHVPPMVTLRSFRRSSSNWSSGRAAQANFRRGMVR